MQSGSQEKKRKNDSETGSNHVMSPLHRPDPSVTLTLIATLAQTQEIRVVSHGRSSEDGMAVVLKVEACSLAAHADDLGVAARAGFATAVSASLEANGSRGEFDAVGGDLVVPDLARSTTHDIGANAGGVLMNAALGALATWLAEAHELECRGEGGEEEAKDKRFKRTHGGCLVGFFVLCL